MRYRRESDGLGTINEAEYKALIEGLELARRHACVLVQEFADIKLCWVPREMNVEADALASTALGRGR
jgi:ribonuclease HI